ncbi:FAD:protein FMN transferase [Clostridium senegalense]|uniref:FAD:protein FMN transferase n=1 Tax=Clostridium senegalense TaxID=1465809 RepID=A0A6M0H4K4_9CLOT|nr:FAD:protein FMN transferase [Clostridium senegalense]NEU05447.1 FAD:protein FMN transferase [Clostridium senegalense]
MNKLKKYSFTFVILSILFLAGCSKTPSEPLSRTELIMGTVCTVQIFDSKDSTILDECFNKLTDLENLVSINKENTELDKVNAMSGKSAVSVSDDTYNIIKGGINYSSLSDGNFDITIGPIVKLWGIGTDSARVPSDAEINEKKSLINYKDVILDDSNKTIFLKNPNMIIDLGGIAKGYAADVLTDILKKHNVNSAMINLGGNLYILGNKEDGNKWRIGIQDPNESNSTVGNLLVNDKSIVTSGVYERFFEENGKKYHHILNPKTGYPYENDLLGVTIISDKSVDGDALSTTTFALGCDEGLKFINSLENIDAIFITKDNEIYLSDGLKDNFNVTNANYKLKN